MQSDAKNGNPEEAIPIDPEVFQPRRRRTDVEGRSAVIPVVASEMPDVEAIVRWEVPDGTPEDPSVCVAIAGVPLTEKAREAMYRLRYQEYRIRFPDKEFPDGIESDGYDGRASHLVARIGEQTVGSMRLLRCEDGFPMEEHDEVLLPNGKPFRFPKTHPRTGIPVFREEAVEASRWVGHRRRLRAGGEILLSFLLLDAGVNVFARTIMKRKYVLAALDERKYQGLLKVGWDIVPLSDPQEYRGGQVRGVWMDMIRACPCPRTLGGRKA